MFQKMSGLEQQLYFRLGEQEQRVFTIQDIVRILNVSLAHARNIAADMTRKNVIERVKSGLFVRIPESVLLDKELYKEDAVLIAAKSHTKAFLSHYTALSIHGLAERYTTQIYVTTPYHQRDILYHEILIKYISVVPKRFFGIKTINYSNTTISVSDIERTILDVINKPKFAGGWNELTQCLKNLESIDWNKLLTYMKKFGNKALARRLGYIFENISTISLPRQIKKQIMKYSGTNIYYFNSTKKGIFDKEWNMIVPIKIKETLHA